MLVIGVTGGIGMGKSTLAGLFAALGIRVLSADVVVHQLMKAGGKGFAPVARAFPEAVVAGMIDRKKLGAIIFASEQKKQQLEAILHPLVRAEELAFVARMQAMRARACVLDIPLLFETGAEVLCDVVCVARAPAWLQRQRVLRRAGMTEAKFQAILEAQMDDAERAERADLVVATGIGKAHTMREVKTMMAELLCAK